MNYNMSIMDFTSTKQFFGRETLEERNSRTITKGELYPDYIRNMKQEEKILYKTQNDYDMGYITGQLSQDDNCLDKGLEWRGKTNLIIDRVSPNGRYEIPLSLHKSIANLENVVFLMSKTNTTKFKEINQVILGEFIADIISLCPNKVNIKFLNPVVEMGYYNVMTALLDKLILNKIKINKITLPVTAVWSKEDIIEKLFRDLSLNKLTLTEVYAERFTTDGIEVMSRDIFEDLLPEYKKEYIETKINVKVNIIEGFKKHNINFMLLPKPKVIDMVIEEWDNTRDKLIKVELLKEVIDEMWDTGKLNNVVDRFYYKQPHFKDKQLKLSIDQDYLKHLLENNAEIFRYISRLHIYTTIEDDLDFKEKYMRYYKTELETVNMLNFERKGQILSEISEIYDKIDIFYININLVHHLYYNKESNNMVIKYRDKGSKLTDLNRYIINMDSRSKLCSLNSFSYTPYSSTELENNINIYSPFDLW